MIATATTCMDAWQKETHNMWLGSWCQCRASKLPTNLVLVRHLRPCIFQFYMEKPDFGARELNEYLANHLETYIVRKFMECYQGWIRHFYVIPELERSTKIVQILSSLDSFFENIMLSSDFRHAYDEGMAFNEKVNHRWIVERWMSFTGIVYPRESVEHSWSNRFLRAGHWFWFW